MWEAPRTRQVIRSDGASAPPWVIRVTEAKWFKNTAPVVPEGARAAVLASANGVLSVKFFDY